MLPRGTNVRWEQASREHARKEQEERDAVARRVAEEKGRLAAAGLESMPSLAEQQGPVQVKVLPSGYRPPVCESDAGDG